MVNAWIDTRRPPKGGTVVLLDTHRNPTQAATTAACQNGNSR
jgi:hypothetical protein